MRIYFNPGGQVGNNWIADTGAMGVGGVVNNNLAWDLRAMLTVRVAGGTGKLYIEGLFGGLRAPDTYVNPFVEINVDTTVDNAFELTALITGNGVTWFLEQCSIELLPRP